MRFEALHTFFNENRAINIARQPQESRPVRVVEFRTAKEYGAVKIDDNADAYYSATTDRDYIVMSISAGEDFSIAMHEYAHSVLHADGLKLPPWLNEGLAELMSTLTITSSQCEFGGALRIRVQTLHRDSWLPESELFRLEPTVLQSRAKAAIFYAESWALADMLTGAPEYAPRFGELIKTLSSGVPSSVALAEVYGKPPAVILNATREWVRHGASPRRRLSPLPQQTATVEVRPVLESEAQMVIADLFVTNGNWGAAERLYDKLLERLPNDPELLASLGSLALRKGDPLGAAKYWARALNTGLKNSTLCYRYALVADQMNFPSERIEEALERAVALQPRFDDARFRLALLKSNRNEYAAAVSNLQAIIDVPPGRAYGYWTALSYALSQVGKRNEAEAAAQQANRFATNPEEHAHAGELAYIAKTEMSVQFRRDAEGKLQLVTTRIPHGTRERNPFVEAEDHIETASGLLQEVQCSDGKLTGFLIGSSSSTLTLLVSDPTHVLIRKGPSEFTCGPQPAINVTVEYATTSKAGHGILRGMEF